MAIITASMFMALDGVVDPAVGTWHFPYFYAPDPNPPAGTYEQARENLPRE